MRSEHLERVRRQLRADPQHGYQEHHPWSACFTAAIKESDFWSRELATPPLSSWLETERKRQLQFPMLQVRRETPQERKGREARDHSVDTKETIFRKRMTMVTSPTTERGLRCAGATIPTDAGQQRHKANARIVEHTSAGFAWGHIRP